MKIQDFKAIGQIKLSQIDLILSCNEVATYNIKTRSYDELTGVKLPVYYDRFFDGEIEDFISKCKSNSSHYGSFWFTIKDENKEEIATLQLINEQGEVL